MSQRICREAVRELSAGPPDCDGRAVGARLSHSDVSGDDSLRDLGVPLRTTILLAVAALAAFGCTVKSPEVGSVPPVRHVAVGGLPDQPLHDADQATNGSSLSGEVDPTNPAAVATDRIIEGLRAQGLEPVDLGAETTASVDDLVTVRVAATHRAGPGATPYTSVYELDLTRGRDGEWEVTRARSIG